MAKENLLDSFYSNKPAEKAARRKGAPSVRKPGEKYCESTYSLTIHNLNYIALQGLDYRTHSSYINALIEKDREEHPDKDKLAQEHMLAEKKRKAR